MSLNGTSTVTTRVAGWMGLPTGADCAPLLARLLGVPAGAPSLLARSGAHWAIGVLPGVGASALETAPDGVVVLLGEDARLEQGARVERARALIEAAGHGGAGAVAAACGESMSIVALPDARQLIAGFDRFCVHPFVYATVGDGLVFASAPALLASHPAVDDALDLQAVYDYLYSSVVPAPRTIFARVRALVNGEMLEHADGKLRLLSAWAPSFDESPGSAIATDAEQEVMRVLESSVAKLVDGRDEVGCFLSGGIDSSTVTGLLARQRPGRVKAFSIGFEAEGYDELEYARISAQAFGVEHHQYYVTADDIVDLIPLVARAYGQPFGNSSVIPVYHCARLAREHGVELMLAGDGGDELFGGNERYARQWLLGLWDSAPAPARALLRRAFGGPCPAPAWIPFVGKARSYVAHASIPLPDRLDVYNYLNRLGASTVLHPALAAEVDSGSPLRAKRELFHSIKASSSLNRMLALDFKVTLSDNDLPKVVMMCAAAGVDVRFPFLAHPVVDFAARLPARDKVERTRLRRFFKRAAAQLLPEAVLKKHKHGFGLPFGTWLNEHARLRACVFELLAGMRERQLIAPAFIDAVRSTHLAEHPRYYGPFIWMIVMLESWLRSWNRTATHGGIS